MNFGKPVVGDEEAEDLRDLRAGHLLRRVA